MARAFPDPGTPASSWAEIMAGWSPACPLRSSPACPAGRGRAGGRLRPPPRTQARPGRRRRAGLAGALGRDRRAGPRRQPDRGRRRRDRAGPHPGPAGRRLGRAAGPGGRGAGRRRPGRRGHPGRAGHGGAEETRGDLEVLGKLLDRRRRWSRSRSRPRRSWPAAPARSWTGSPPCSASAATWCCATCRRYGCTGCATPRPTAAAGRPARPRWPAPAASGSRRGCTSTPTASPPPAICLGAAALLGAGPGPSSGWCRRWPPRRWPRSSATRSGTCPDDAAAVVAASDGKVLGGRADPRRRASATTSSCGSRSSCRCSTCTSTGRRWPAGWWTTSSWTAGSRPR